MTQAEQSRSIAGRYNEIAERYLRHSAGLLLEPGLQLVEGLDLATAKWVLEVAAGTGRLLPHIASTAPRAQIVAADLSEGMIRLAPDHYPRVVTDVTALPCRDEVFDGVLMAFALFHVLEPHLALAEMTRVLVPGGRLGVAVWATSDDSPAETLFMSLLDDLGVPTIPPRLTSAELINTEGKLTGVLMAAGLRDVVVERRHVVDPMDVDEFIERRTHLGLHSEKYRLLAPDKRPAFLERVRSVLRSRDPDDLTSVDIALLAWAQKPS